MYIAKLRGKNVYFQQPTETYTPILAEATRYVSVEMASRCTKDWNLRNSAICLEFVEEKFAIQDQVRAFIHEYTKGSERTHGEKAAVAAMSTLVFHASGGTDLGALENSTLRTIQVLQAFMGLLSRMETSNETKSDPATPV